MGKYWRHFKTVCRHKHYVFVECWKCGIPIRGLLHDLSKFGPTEFCSSARYFQGTRSPIEAEKEATGYSRAWLHHKSHNKHHWEYWTDFDKDGSVIAYKMPYKYVVEMVCDFVGAGKAYSKEKWTQEEPLRYWYKVRAGRHFHESTEVLAVYMLKTLAENGLDAFHNLVTGSSGKALKYVYGV